MKSAILLALALSVVPVGVWAMPAVGAKVGTNPTDAAAALTAAGCDGAVFGAEGGKIEAKCTDHATGAAWEVYIDPKTGVVADLKEGD